MAPKNETLIWVALGIGGLYLLSQNNDSKDTTIAITVETKPAEDGDGGATRTESPEDMDEDDIHLTFGGKKGPEKKGDPPTKKVVDEFNPSGKREGPTHPFHNIIRFREYQSILGDAGQLDREVANVFRLYHSRRGKDLGELGQGMEKQMHESLT